MYLESSGGDYVGLEKTYLYNASNSEIWSNSGGNYLNVLVNGDQQWKAVFHAMESMGSIQVGYYPELRAYPLHNPTRGGMYWTGDGRGCSVINGWFAVDSLTVEDGIIKGFDLRFEQHCEGRASMLRGAVHWRADAAVTPVTISPSPAGSWRPPSGALDTNVNNLYLEGDPSGMPWYRRLHHFTPANATIAATASARTLQITATSGTTWTGDFQLSGNGVQLTPGLYGDLTRFMFPGQAEPGISWGGEHRGCSAPRGWLAIDSIAYDNGQLSAIDLRFEQVCEGAPLPTHGALHWRAESAVPAPGPIPAVVEMWRPPVAVVPASGTYVYLAPDRSDFIAGGSMYRYTHATAGNTLTENDGALVLAVDGDEAGDDGAGDGVVHPVQAAQEGGLAAARVADEGCHRAVADVHGHVLEGVGRPVVDVDAPRGDLRGGGVLHGAHVVHVVPHQRRSKRRRTSTAARFMASSTTRRTMIPPQARS